MFPPAVQSLTDACLPPLWNTQYTGFAGLFALLAVLSSQLVQTTAINHFSRKHHDEHTHATHDTSESNETVDDMACSHHAHHSHDHLPASQRSSSHKKDFKMDSTDTKNMDNHISALDAEDIETATVPNNQQQHSHTPVELGALTTATNIHSDGCCQVDHNLMADSSDHHHLQITAYILEFGIALHSVIIGLTIGVTDAQSFTSLLIATSFHQMFDGIALATTALEAGFKSKTQPILMALMYTLTTPTGVVIGILISKSFSGQSSSSLLASGILDSISAGILIYDALVNLITVNITHSKYFSKLSIFRKLLVFICMWVGAAIMAALGAYV